MKFRSEQSATATGGSQRCFTHLTCPIHEAFLIFDIHRLRLVQTTRIDDAHIRVGINCLTGFLYFFDSVSYVASQGNYNATL